MQNDRKLQDCRNKLHFFLRSPPLIVHNAQKKWKNRNKTSCGLFFSPFDKLVFFPLCVHTQINKSSCRAFFHFYDIMQRVPPRWSNSAVLVQQLCICCVPTDHSSLGSGFGLCGWTVLLVTGNLPRPLKCCLATRCCYAIKATMIRQLSGQYFLIVALCLAGFLSHLCQTV